MFILTEFRNNKYKSKIQNHFKELGFGYIATTESDSKTNSVLIASKLSISSETFEQLNEHKQRVIKINLDNFTIYGCYFPGQDLKKHVFEFLLSEIKRSGVNNVIITGDINTGKHFLDEERATFYHAAYLNKFEDVGLIDAWRHINGQQKEYTWFSNKGNGFRIDHFFIDQNLSGKITNCYYSHQYRIDNISDHSMMTLELDSLI